MLVITSWFKKCCCCCCWGSGRHFALDVGHIVGPLNYSRRDTKHRHPCNITPFDYCYNVTSRLQWVPNHLGTWLKSHEIKKNFSGNGNRTNVLAARTTRPLLKNVTTNNSGCCPPSMEECKFNRWQWKLKTNRLGQNIASQAFVPSPCFCLRQRRLAA